MFFVDKETYKKHKDAVLELSQSIQVNYVEHLAPEKRKPGLSDAQIAEKLGLDERTVREIRCVGEREYYPIDEWEKAVEFKEDRCRGYARQGLSHVTKKYVIAERNKQH
jgi:ribosome-binding protein aMBF1 (putative translation factor)